MNRIMNRAKRRRAQAAARVYDKRLERDRFTSIAGRSAKPVMLGSFATWKAGMNELSMRDQLTLGGITIGGPGIGTNVRRLIERQTAQILAEHGARAFESPKTSAAVHEAGHVRLHSLHGDRVTVVSIRQHEAGGWLGYTTAPSSAFNCPGNSATTETFLKVSRNLFAGLCAERMFDPDYREGSSLDEWIMSQLLGDLAAQGPGSMPRPTGGLKYTSTWRVR
jgi:hypothetical protein